MVNLLLEKTGGILDRRFVLAWLFPTCLAGLIGLVLFSLPTGINAVWQGWLNQPALAQTSQLVGGLLLLLLLAYLLQAFSHPLVQLYEGYWPHWLRQWLARGPRKAWERLNAQIKTNRDQAAVYWGRRYYEYPSEAKLILPTRLGNRLRAAESYPGRAYGIDAVFWWPRLMPLLPQVLLEGIADALTPFLALLNLATLLVVVSAAGAAYLWWSQAYHWLLPLGVLIGGVLLACLSYEGAVAQTSGYSQLLRAAFDLHRFDLLKALHIPLPGTPEEEKVLWGQLTGWLYMWNDGAAQAVRYEHKKDDQRAEKVGDG